MQDQQGLPKGNGHRASREEPPQDEPERDEDSAKDKDGTDKARRSGTR